MTRPAMPHGIGISVPPPAQSLVIPAWLPEQVANARHAHWGQRYTQLKHAQVTVWAAAMRAKWRPIKGRAKLTVTFIFPQQRRRDVDNLYARAKGVVDGVKRGGWIVDDDSAHLDLVVRAEVQHGVKATVLLLEPVT